MRVVPGLVLFAACAAALPSVGGQEPNRKELFKALEKQLKETAEAVGPSVATVVVSRSEHYPKPPGAADTPGRLGGFDPREFLKADPTPERARLTRFLDLSDVKGVADHGYAGGVVIDAAGYVLTPYHVIDGATKVYVFLPGGKGSYADIRAADARSDLAVLKLLDPPPKLQPVKFADVRTVGVRGRDPTVFPGKLCVLVANPYSAAFGIGRPSAAFGSITNVRYRAPTTRDERTAGRRYPEYAPLLEYDMKLGAVTVGGINAAMTGGVLANLDGAMIGLTNAAAVAWDKEVGPGYAVPADDHFRRVVDVLKRGEEVEYGFLGVRKPDPRQDPFVEADAVIPIPGGAAAEGGLQTGDVIVRINGVPLGNDSFDDLLLHVGSALAGSKVQIAVSRNRRIQEFDVTLGKFTHGEPFIASVRPEPVFGLRVDYTSVLVLRQDRAQRGNIPPGVCVREVADDSPAAKQFKALGDNPLRWVVTHVNGVAVASPAEFYKAARGQEKVRLAMFDPNESPRRDRELTLP